MVKRNIITKHIIPPIPTRQYDWTAYLDGWDLGEPIGYGENKQDAINDLLAQLPDLNTRQ